VELLQKVPFFSRLPPGMDHRSFLELRIRIRNCKIISRSALFSVGCHQAWIIAASYSWWNSRAAWSSVGTSSQLRIKVGPESTYFHT
jgi:hypothetical protein